MPKPLTTVAIANLKRKPKRYEVPDPGCPGMKVVIFPTGKKSYILRFRYRGLQRKLTLGPVLSGKGEPCVKPRPAKTRQPPSWPLVRSNRLLRATRYRRPATCT